MAKNPVQVVLTISTSHRGRRKFKAFACGTIRNHPIPAAKSRSNQI